MDELWYEIEHPEEDNILVLVPGIDEKVARRVERLSGLLERGFRRVKLERFPVVMTIDKETTEVAKSTEEFLEIASKITEDIEGWILNQRVHVEASRERDGDWG